MNHRRQLTDLFRSHCVDIARKLLQIVVLVVREVPIGVVQVLVVLLGRARGKGAGEGEIIVSQKKKLGRQK